VTLPKQNRPLVRDGRIQPKKKRTDRSYLRAEPQGAEIAEAPIEDETVETMDASDVVRAAAMAAAADPVAALTPPEPEAAVPFKRTSSGKLPTTVRAIQQQGVRKRREFDVKALAIRDTKYAMHELRRIAILATMVVVTLVVLTFVLR
jgi:hypothetical protein